VLTNDTFFMMSNT